MAENEQNLKPCPFCGGAPAFIGDTRTIKCKCCGGAFICTNPLISALEVAEAWNRRADRPTVANWIEATAEWRGHRGDYTCSACGEEAPNDGYNPAKYCYNCGRKMTRRKARGTE